MDRNDRFFVEYHDGNYWRKIAQYQVEENFTNGSFHHEQGIIINEGPGLIFPENMRIRFRCDFNKRTDKIFIDEVIVSAR